MNIEKPHWIPTFKNRSPVNSQLHENSMPFWGKQYINKHKNHFKFVLTVTLWNQRHGFVYTPSAALLAAPFRTVQVGRLHPRPSCPGRVSHEDVQAGVHWSCRQSRKSAGSSLPHRRVGGRPGASLCPSVRGRGSLDGFQTPVQFLPPLCTLRSVFQNLAFL